MKRLLYILLLVAELFIGTVLMIGLWNSSLYIPITISLVALISLLTWQIFLLAKTKDSEAMRKIMFRIALIMIIPIAVYMVTYFILAILAIIAFGFGV